MCVCVVVRESESNEHKIRDSLFYSPSASPITASFDSLSSHNATTAFILTSVVHPSNQKIVQAGVCPLTIICTLSVFFQASNGLQMKTVSSHLIAETETGKAILLSHCAVLPH